jgi:hypothetical protein
MKTIQKWIYSLLFALSLNVYAFPALSTNVREVREVIEVSQKKHIQAEHIKGFDTYDHPIDYHIEEQYILRFKDRNGFFVVPKRVYDKTEVGDMFTTEDDQLYYCRYIDNCYDSTL